MVSRQEGEEPLVFITYDGSTFNANDGKRKIWGVEGTNPLRPKGRSLLWYYNNGCSERFSQTRG
jgi:hypothetical protein